MHNVYIVHAIAISVSGVSGAPASKHMHRQHVKSTIAYVNSQRIAAQRHAMFKKLLPVIWIRPATRPHFMPEIAVITPANLMRPGIG